ncbi:universal stress protein [Actinoallomurus iriomotensis]|uniref:Universal stress protein n=1 Tax=Actinoallomurus iriomotensis TaxID=478107 RepID=A0A9W6S5U3_9ACTN|nr:universal stress protein [Actinoallomurus iriomotensis]GLY88905.1 universal stress protein [Actinoallomurus iriomotensis]
MGDRDGRRPVVVGYDGSPGADQALCWGAEEAQLRDLPLVIFHAWHWPYPFHPLAQQVLEQVENVGAAVLEAGVDRVRELAEGLEVRTHLAKGTSAAVMLEAARDAELVVLGSRGHGGFEDLQAGSAAMQVPAHADRPVIVVRPTLPPARRDGVWVTVGVDGSPASQAALAFAFAEAELRGGSVVALCAWWDTSALPGPNRLPFTDTEMMRRAARERFEEWLRPWAARHPKVAVRTEFKNERPQGAVNEMARGAVLLVLGARGVGAVPATRLGPVTQSALLAAPCPVAVTPP